MMFNRTDSKGWLTLTCLHCRKSEESEPMPIGEFKSRTGVVYTNYGARPDPEKMSVFLAEFFPTWGKFEDFEVCADCKVLSLKKFDIMVLESSTGLCYPYTTLPAVDPYDAVDVFRSISPRFQLEICGAVENFAPGQFRMSPAAVREYMEDHPRVAVGARAPEYAEHPPVGTLSASDDLPEISERSPEDPRENPSEGSP